MKAKTNVKAPGPQLFVSMYGLSDDSLADLCERSGLEDCPLDMDKSKALLDSFHSNFPQVSNNVRVDRSSLSGKGR